MPDQQKQMFKYMIVVLPAGSLIFTSYMAGITQVMFATATIMSYIQSRILTNNDFRRRLGITLLPDPAVADLNNKPYKGVINAYQPPTTSQAPVPRSLWAKLKGQAQTHIASNNKKATRLSKVEKQRADQYEKQRRDEIEADELRNTRNGRRR